MENDLALVFIEPFINFNDIDINSLDRSRTFLNLFAIEYFFFPSFSVKSLAIF